MDLVTPMALRGAATLRLADLVAAGAEQVDEPARRSGKDAGAPARLLRHLARHGVLTETSPGQFTLNDKAELLRSDHPERLRRRCAEAAGPAGRVLVVEYGMSAGADPAMYAERDLRILVNAGGRERSVEEHQRLAAAAHLAPAGVITTPSGHVLLDSRAV